VKIKRDDTEAEYLANREGYQVLRAFYLHEGVDDKLKAKLPAHKLKVLARRKRLKEACEQYDGSEQKFREIVAEFIDLMSDKKADLEKRISASWETLKSWAQGSSCPATQPVRQIFINEIKNLLNEG